MNKLNHILIVGGGTAGWMTANLLAKEWQGKVDKITVLESSQIGTIGVGEGTTPFMQDFFKKLDIEEKEWMPACNATYKTGIRFPGWSTKPGYTSYFHPFYSEIDTDSAMRFFSDVEKRHCGGRINVNPQHYFITSRLAEAGKAPFHKNDRTLNSEYGYHFDAALMGQFLRKKAMQRGVNHIDDVMLEAETAANGNISRILCKESGWVAADFFIDCSGLRGLLIQQALGQKQKSYSDRLINDAAVALPTAIDEQRPLPSFTNSVAAEFGWMWRIPLQNRMGNGYVFSSACASHEAAEKELRQSVNAEKLGVEAKHISWTPGRLHNHWYNNCVAIGLSQGFLEPLEAPMLNITQHSIEMFMYYFQAGNASNRFQSRFNAEVNNLIDGTVDYIQAHYLLNSRKDSIYWRFCRENQNQSDALKDIISSWKSTGNIDAALRAHAHTQPYFKTSWLSLLAGLGSFTQAVAEPENNAELLLQYKNKVLLATDYADHRMTLAEHHKESLRNAPELERKVCNV